MTDSVQSHAPLEIIDLGRRSYEEVYALQQERLKDRIEGRVGDAVFIVEHDPVITRGRRSAEGDVSGVPFPVVSIERGGEATYHGPGQLVAYPILFLPEGRRDLHRYLRDLEEVVIETLRGVGVEGRREDGLTGVWIGDKKVCSIGVAVRRWVTWHGLALNVTTDMGAFTGFAPCGLSADVMTRVQDEFSGEESPAQLMDACRESLIGALRRGF